MATAHVCTLETGSLFWFQISSLCFELVANAGEDQGSRQLVDGFMLQSADFVQAVPILEITLVLNAPSTSIPWMVTSVTKQSPS